MKRPAMALVLALTGCASSPAPPAATVAATTVLPDLPARLARLPRTVLDADRSRLPESEKKALDKLIEASRLLDQIFLRQVDPESPRVRASLAESAAHRDALALFDVMKGRWDRLDHDRPFVAPFDGPAGVKPPGGGFYPRDLGKEELERWIAAHPADKDAFQGLFTVIRRDGGKLVAIPYSKAYAEWLTPASHLLLEAAALTREPSLRAFLAKRAKALLSDDYYESDFAWMDLASAIEPVIGPYEVYEDNLFNYKASFQSFLTLVDEEESKKLAVYASHLAAMERGLPIPDEHKNPGRGADSPIRVVNEVFTAGDARSGVQTAAFNLPNDEKVREAKGSKKVLLKNVMEAKYETCGLPVADLVLDPGQRRLVSFDAYFSHTLFHELSHGLGPGIITGPDGKKVDGRLLLKDLYSTIEECKADVLGVWNLLYALDHGLVTSFDESSLYATNVGLLFRSLRFGLNEAHGRGTAIQWTYYREKGAIVEAGGRFRFDGQKMKEATRSLAHDLLMLEALGDYAAAKTFVDRWGRATKEIEGVVARMTSIPVDITPVFPAAGER